MYLARDMQGQLLCQPVTALLVRPVIRAMWHNLCLWLRHLHILCQLCEGADWYDHPCHTSVACYTWHATCTMQRAGHSALVTPRTRCLAHMAHIGSEHEGGTRGERGLRCTCASRLGNTYNAQRKSGSQCSRSLETRKPGWKSGPTCFELTLHYVLICAVFGVYCSCPQAVSASYISLRDTQSEQVAGPVRGLSNKPLNSSIHSS